MGRNIQTLPAGQQFDGSMKVSETRDSSMQVLGNSGFATQKNILPNLQVNFNNTNNGIIDEVSDLFRGKNFNFSVSNKTGSGT